MAIADIPRTKTQTDDREQIDVMNPVTRERIGQIPVYTVEDVEDVAERARFAQKSWGALTAKERTVFIRRWVDLMWEHQDELIAMIRAENGKTDAGAFIEVNAIDGIAQYYIHHAAKILKPQRRRSLFPLIQWAKVYHKPHGVVAVISPWNYPFLLSFIDVIPALLAGNAVIMKPSEVTPFTVELGVELMYQAGIPRDVIQVVYGDGRSGRAVIDVVDFVHFTGSTEVGRKVGKHCGERLMPFSLELGGNDPAIVLEDADLDQTAIGLIQGAFENTGQTCISIERVYALESIYEPLMERIQHYYSKIILSARDGMDVTVGSMTNAVELERTQHHIQDALDKGATIVAGGKPRPDIGEFFFEPTVITDVDHSMELMTIETFGPLLPVMKVKSVDEAIELANDSSYGLSASVFSKNLKHAQALALRINSGDVAVNRAQYVIGSPGLPSGGQKDSGFGRRNGPEGLLKYTYTQSILLDNLLDRKLLGDEGVGIVTPSAVKVLEVVRAIRRYIPFI